MSEKEFIERLLKIFDKKRLGEHIDTDIKQNEFDELADLEDLYPIFVHPVIVDDSQSFFELIGFDYPYTDKNGNSKTFNFDSRKSMVQLYNDIGVRDDPKFQKELDDFLNSEDLNISRSEFLELIIKSGKQGKKFTFDEEYFKKRIENSFNYDSPILKLFCSDIIYKFVKDYLNNSLYVEIASVLENVEDDLKDLLKEVANNDEYVRVLNRLLEEVKYEKDTFNKSCKSANWNDEDYKKCLEDYYIDNPSVRYCDLVDVDALADKMFSECSKYNDYSLDEVARVMFPYIPSNYTLKSDFVELSLVALNNSEYINDNGKPYTTQGIASYLKYVAENGFEITEQQSSGRKK